MYAASALGGVVLHRRLVADARPVVGAEPLASTKPQKLYIYNKIRTHSRSYALRFAMLKPQTSPHPLHEPGAYG